MLCRPGPSGSVPSTRWSARSSRVRSCGRTSGRSSRGRPLRRSRPRCPKPRRLRHLCRSFPRSILRRRRRHRRTRSNRSRSLPKRSSPRRRARRPMRPPDVLPIFMPQVHAPDPEVARALQVPVVDSTNVIGLESRVKRWRTIASALGALAAALLVTLSLQIFQPDALPGALRPAPRIQTVEVKTPAPLTASSQFVALLQGQGGGAAFILTIDGATRNFTVRKVGATLEPGKSFELWLISDKLPRPRSLGVIGTGDFTARPVLGSYDADVVNGATYAVTVEQAGGSPNGQPTSAPVFSGKLIETVPPSQPQQQAPAKK
ncbi:anti-sigma factor [Bradyrhizobium sp. NAS80.1]|uniref:anti-sigma factor n=1 Tax=Bradyrhizobium sp. NAS80.1 TaxID=1680159 RepID=UPI000A042BE5|nr:anti-sigma factor [Bradyrhizobium sp. NAS80.1]